MLHLYPAFPARARRSGKTSATLCALIAGLAAAIFSPSPASAQLFTQHQALFGDANPGEYFGYYVAASGDTLVVSTSSNKRIYVFVDTPSGWVLQQKIAANYSDQSFGRIAIDGDTLVAGNEIYVRTNGGWTLQQALPFGGDPRPAVQGDTVVIGQPRAANGDANGSVWVFTRSGTTWTQRALLFPDTPGNVEMGTQVRIDGGTIVATTQNGSFGAAYGAYVFTGSGATWTQQARLVSPTGGWWMSVAIDGDTVALSDPANNRINLFARSGTNWNLTDTIPIPATGNNYFGDQLALSGGFLAASADGIFYVLTKTSSGWIAAQSFTRPGNEFGALDLTRRGKTFVLSNPYDNTQAAANGLVEVYTVPSPPPPGGGWQDDDVGAVGVAGGSADNNGTVTVSGSGADIWDRADQFHFRSQTLTGDGAIVARVTATGSGNPWSKIGLMFREDLAPAARTALMLLTPGNHFGTQFRADTFEPTGFSDAGWVGPPQWMMLARAGNTFASYRSDNGVSWTSLGSATVVMPATVYVGLAVSSHDNTTLNTGTFDGVELISTSASPGAPQPPSNLTASANSSSVIHLTWTDNANNESGTQVERSTDGATFTLIASPGTNTTSYFDTGLSANNTYYYRVRAFNTAGSSAYSNITQVTTQDPPPSDQLVGEDIGDVAVPGSVSTANGVTTIAAAGDDIWDQADSFYFYNRAVTGNFELHARITSLGDTDPWAKAGVMIRATLDPGAPNVFAMLTAGNAAGLQSRATPGASTNFTSGLWVSTPYWVFLSRNGNTFTALVSPDGANWTLLGTQTVDMPTTVYAGVAVTSHNPSTATQATITSLAFGPN